MNVWGILLQASSAFESAWTGSPVADQTRSEIEAMKTDAKAVSTGMEDEFNDAIRRQDDFVESTAWQVRWSRIVI